MEVSSKSTQETKELAEKLAGRALPKDIYALYGDLGSGKTTFTGFFVKSLGFDNRVQSPTFVIVRRYQRDTGSIKRVYHVDLYRLTKTAELVDLGLEEMFSDNEAITIIEWPELLEGRLPANSKKLHFSYVDENSRNIDV